MSDQTVTQEMKKLQFLSGDSSFILDLVRVIACEMIVLCHILGMYLLYKNREFDNIYLEWKTVAFLAQVGVMLFFFVSGIVIANSLFSKMRMGKYGFVSYFADRFSRIYSGLVPGLIIILFLDVLILWIDRPLYLNVGSRFGAGDLAGSVFLASLMMIQSLPPFNIPQPHFAQVLWTLNIEWWLYMLFGWMVIYGKRIKKLDWKAASVLLALSLIPAYRFLGVTDSTGSLIPVWFFGVLIAILLSRGKYVDFIRKYFKYLFGLAIILTAIRIAQICIWDLLFYDVVLELLIGCLILIMIVNYNGSSRLPFDRLKVLIKTMARYSFTLYLIHMALIGLILAIDNVCRFNLPFIGIFLIALLLTNSVALAVASVTEMRYKKLSGWIKGKTAGIRVLQSPASPQ
ncbi:MAG TPA: acyltransferase [Methanocella sp.]|jgi:peptidoglycan/LPS O-acetylase OafA/YrhL